MMTHFGDPCIHCLIPHDAVVPGGCAGDAKLAIPVAYRSLGVRHDHVEGFLIRMSDGRVLERHSHIDENAAEFHFGYSRSLTHPPRYDERLKREGGGK